MTKEHLFTKVRILQIMPSAPDTFAIYKCERLDGESDKKELIKVAVPAWGIWLTWQTMGSNLLGKREIRVGFVERNAGPLIINEYGDLYPACLDGEYVGVRVGDFSVVSGTSRFDSEEKLSEVLPEDVGVTK